MEIISLQGRPDLLDKAAAWFHHKWGIPEEAYRESMLESLRGGTVPQWYLVLENGEMLGGAGVIENDFHHRKDLAPNVCAVYVVEAQRNRGIAGKLLDHTCRHMASLGIRTLYLLTDHIGFYERYGWEFFCTAMGEGEEKPSRVYRKITY